MRWIASAHPSTKVDAKMCERGFWRLYAYPREPLPPPEGGFTLLNSGAYGLSQYGAKITIKHMESLAEYYAAQREFTTLCIAPDEFLNPQQTVRNFEYWQRFQLPVVPVIQFSKKRRVNVQELAWQWRFYRKYESALPRYANLPVIAIGNSCNAQDYRSALLYIKMLRREWSVWLHLLGAGYTSSDLRDHAQLKITDSLDSIAYYTAAQDKTRWSVSSGDARDCNTSSTELALWNAEVAARIIN